MKTKNRKNNRNIFVLRSFIWNTRYCVLHYVFFLITVSCIPNERALICRSLDGVFDTLCKRKKQNYENESEKRNQNNLELKNKLEFCVVTHLYKKL